MSVLVIDYGMGNLGSVKRSLEECGARVLVSHHPTDISKASHIILPGVGSFSDGISNLKSQGWFEPLKKSILEQWRPFLGICLGMQLLADRGYEGDVNEGLGIIPGEVVKLQPQSASEHIPHVGWNEVYPVKSHPIFKGILPGTDFYFVHSYQLMAAHLEHVLALTPYCGNFVSAVIKHNVVGVQFHPEKSQRPGLQLLRNFLSL
ncbi:MAG: imidazole glycerol phosphate synthase subunit HisH [Candidatus Omnitrophica bacterium]|nr:imidazole glycerol phosphate synthase subunit HisH [Candidatus Omnitrophota bacterium]